MSITLEYEGKHVDDPVVIQMLEIRGEILVRLAENEDYRRLKAIERAIAEIMGNAPAADVGSSLPRAKHRPPEKVEMAGLSQADASQVLLTKVLHEPVVIARLVSALGAHGINVGGNNPNINLSSVLSKDGRFRSVRYRDRACWWVKGTPFPGELDAE